MIGQVREHATDVSLEVGVAAGTSFALLVALARASREPREDLPGELASALDDVGDSAGEVWLNLLGIPLDAGPPFDTDRLRAELEGIDAVELRRHLFGRYAWSWCTLAGVDDIEAAAAGDARAATRLLAHPRYYGGHAADSLAVLAVLGPDETRRRILRVVDAGARALIGEAARLELAAVRREAEAVRAAASPLAAIERIALGYRYVPEPEAERVLLIPHLEPAPALILAQHRAARLVVYRAHAEQKGEERLLALGRALADPKRIEILRLLGRGVARVPELIAATGLSRSTVHYHLTQLREAGLIVLQGNARAYTYVPREDAAADASLLLAEVIGTPETRLTQAWPTKA